MEMYLPLGHLLAIHLIIICGYGIYVYTFYKEFMVVRYWEDGVWSSCTNGEPLCPNQFTVSKVSYPEHVKFEALIKTGQPFHIDFKARNLTSEQIWTTLKQSGEQTFISEQIVWSDSSTVPPYVYNNRTHVEPYFYSLKTLKKDIPDMSVELDYDSLTNCISKALDQEDDCKEPMFVLSLANAFLNNKRLGHGRGAVCHLDKKYTCCQQNDKDDKYTCSSYNPWMIGIFYTTLIIAAFVFCCFPAHFVRFPDEKDSSETISGNTQASNPLYRITNCAAQTIRCYSAEYYFINVITKCFIGFSLPLFFYMNWGLRGTEIELTLTMILLVSWFGNNVLVVRTLIYGVVVMVISLLPRTDSLDFSLSPAYHQKMVKYQRALIINAQNETGLNLMKSSWSLTRKFFIQFCFGFKGFADGQTSLCWRVITFVCSCLLLVIVFPVLAVYILIGYCLYILPLGRQISILFCYADIYFYWFAWRLTRLCRIGRKRHEKRTSSCGTAPTPNHALYTVVRVIGLLFILAFIVLFFLIMISDSLQIFSNLLVHLYIGLLASKDELMPIIGLASIFALYMWDSCSSVGNDYIALLEMTFHECKRYQRKERNRVIKFDNNGIPRIHRLSDLFQNVCDELQPFREEYISMCLQLMMIALFLSLTYCCISVFGQAHVSEYSKAAAVILGGLVPKMVHMFNNEATEHLEDKEKAYQIRKIVYAFFSSQITNVGREKHDLDQGDGSPDEESSDGSCSSDYSSERSVHQLDVDFVDTAPSQLWNMKNDQNAEKTVLLPSRDPSTRDQMGKQHESSV